MLAKKIANPEFSCRKHGIHTRGPTRYTKGSRVFFRAPVIFSSNNFFIFNEESIRHIVIVCTVSLSRLQIDPATTTIASMSDTYNEPLLAKISAGSEITNNDLEKLNALFDSDDVGKISYLRRGVLEELSNKKHPQFVRHIGMVQDQLEPEYYVNQIDGKSTHFRDFPPCHIPDADIQSNLSERQPLFVVPIPWASSWLADSLASKEEGVPERQAMDTEIETLETETSRKRERDSDDENLASRQRTQCKQAQQHRLHARQQHNGFSNWWPDSSPNPNSHCPVIAKFYFDHSSNEKHGKLRLNDLVETIGEQSFSS